MVRRASLTSLAKRVPRVSAVLLAGQVLILALIATTAFVAGIWWIAGAAVTLLAVALIAMIINAKRDDWFV